jgi:fructose-bisphosphate aldolase class I
LRSKNIHCGIKVDTGLQVIGGTNEETATQGLDGLGKRCAEYYGMGCRFAKWRAVCKIGQGLPSDAAVRETAHSLARYGSICQ